MIKKGKIDGLMISSTDARWNESYENKMMHRLKNINKNITLNASDSGEKVNDGRWVLKGGKATAL